MIGEVDRRAAARERFEEALVTGRSAALLEEDRASLFTQRLGNVPARTDITVVLTHNPEFRLKPTPRWLGKIAYPDFPQVGRVWTARQNVNYNAALDLMRRPPAGVRIHVFRPLRPMPVGSFTIDRKRIEAALALGRFEASQQFEPIPISTDTAGTMAGNSTARLTPSRIIAWLKANIVTTPCRSPSISNQANLRCAKAMANLRHRASSSAPMPRITSLHRIRGAQYCFSMHNHNTRDRSDNAS